MLLYVHSSSSALLDVHRNRKEYIRGGEPRTAISTLTQLLSSAASTDTVRITRDGNLSFVVVCCLFCFWMGLNVHKKRIRFIRYWAGLEVCVLRGGGGGGEGRGGGGGGRVPRFARFKQRFRTFQKSDLPPPPEQQIGF